MFDPPAFDAFFEAGRYLALEVAMQFASQETQGILTGAAQNGMLEQVWQDRFQAGAIFEHQVGSHFALVGYPIVTTEAGLPNDVQDGVHPFGQSVEHGRPFEVGELLTESLCGRQVSDVGEAVVIALISDALLIEITRQAFPTVDVNLDLEREPAL